MEQIPIVAEAATGVARPIQIARRFEGWAGLANGGYLAGLLARELGGPLEVTFHRPTPLETGLWLRRPGDLQGEIADEQGLLVTAKRIDEAVDPPEAIPFARAVEARRRYHGFREIPFPTCFVCGPERSPDDALCIFPGALEPGRVAAPWVPTQALGGDGRIVPTEYVVAALDCPGAWAVASVSARLCVPMMLGRVTVECFAPVVTGEPHVVIGAATGEDGRKRFSTTAVYDSRGGLCAAGRSVWIARRT